jgi:hypothetical protein
MEHFLALPYMNSSKYVGTASSTRSRTSVDYVETFTDDAARSSPDPSCIPRARISMRSTNSVDGEREQPLVQLTRTGRVERVRSEVNLPDAGQVQGVRNDSQVDLLASNAYCR